MILKNNKGIEREFNILFEVEKNNKKYIIYRDPLTDNIYGGKCEGDTLKVLTDAELDFVNNILKKLNGEK